MAMNTIYECMEKHYNLTSLEKRLIIEKSITTHGGKMEGIPSISTSVLLNSRCQKRQKCKNCICAKCYAQAYTDYRKTLAEKLRRNTIFYTTYRLTKKDVPLINSKYFRFEAFGDIINELHFENYCTIAKANRDTYFVLWTKNPDIIQKAVENGVTIPKNMRIIFSEAFINFPIDIEYFSRYKKLYPFINKMFAVYDPEYIERNNIKVNCGGKKCLECMRCYNRSDRTKLIYEKMK